MFVCGLARLFVCLAMRFVVLGRIELKLGRVAGNGPPRFLINLSKRPNQWSEVIRRSIYLENPMATKFGRNNP